MIIDDSAIILTVIPLILSWTTTIITIIWKFDKRITRNETELTHNTIRVEKCEQTLEKHESIIEKIEASIHG